MDTTLLLVSAIVIIVMIGGGIWLTNSQGHGNATQQTARTATRENALTHAANSALMQYKGVVGEKNNHGGNETVEVWLGDDGILRIKAKGNNVSLLHLVGMNVAVLTAKSGRKLCDVQVTEATVGGDSVVRVVLPNDKVHKDEEVSFSRLTVPEKEHEVSSTSTLPTA